jgi:MOSC domain-containing protein YiiM
MADVNEPMVTDERAQFAAADPNEYNPVDLGRTLGALGPWWEQVVTGWSADASRAAEPLLAAQRALLESAVSDDLTGRARTGSLDDLSAIWKLGEILAVPTAGEAWEANARELVGASVLLLHQAGRALRAAGAGPEPATGHVAQLNVSDGGVPKRPVDCVEVTSRGLAGDRQRTRLHHGRPWQALCLWSSETIASLAAEGHPIAPGRAGENVTIAGLPWARVRAGLQLRIGEVLVETTPFSLPCRNNAQWFRDGDFTRIHHERGAGLSRIYAMVIEPGRIATGDAVTLLP